MNRKILLLNVCLLALLGALGWMLRARWLEARAKERLVLSQAPRRTELLSPPSPPLPAPANASEYTEVVAKTLFAKDRDPNVIIVPPPAPPPVPEEPVPPRPVYHGQMKFGEPVAILSIDSKNTQRGYHAGENVGPFKLVAFDHDQIQFEWNGKKLEYKLSELKPSVSAAPQQPAAQAAPAPPTPAAPVLGAKSGERRNCVYGDTSPAGTVKDGFRKVILPGVMGSTCYWEQAN